MEQIGPYAILGEVARGGMGVVYRARGPDGRDVALKLLLAQRANQPNAHRRFQTEVESLARLQHPNVVTILAAGEHQGTPWLALDFVQGESLQARLQRGPLPIWEALRTAQQLARALAYVHSCGVVHRDLKPDNVLLRGDQALLTDFGLARDAESERSRITASGVFQGTPGYWAPEQAAGDTPRIGPLTDVYGLGAVLYACLTGRAPAEADSLQAYLHSALTERPPEPRALRPEVPDWLSALCMRCLERAPEDRPASVEEVARDLLLARAAGHARPGTTRTLAAAALLACLGLAGVVWAAFPNTTSLNDAELPAAHPALDPAQLQTLINEADALLESGRHEEGLSTLNQALRLAPNSQALLRRRGSALNALNRPEEALVDLERALSLDPDDPQALTLHGRAQGKLGRLQAAVRDFDRALELDPDFSFAYGYRGGARLKLGLHDEALADLQQARRLRGEDAITHSDVGALLVALNRYEDALGPLADSARLDPSQAGVFHNQAIALAKLNDLVPALASIDRALQLEPRDPESLVLRGSIHNKLGALDAAVADFSVALRLDPDLAAAYTRRGMALAKLARYPEALRDFDAALRLSPDDIDALLNRGTVKNELEDYEGAIEDMNATLSHRPESGRAYLQRGMAKAALGRFSEAVADFDLALPRMPPAVEPSIRRLRAEAAQRAR